MNVRNAREIGLLIRNRRKALGIGQQMLAGRLGVSRYWISQLENGNPGAAIGQTLNALSMLGIALDARTAETNRQTGPSAADMFAAILDGSRE